ncbi:helix-turn-helix domain-containing protein [Hymenobacter elongatus]|uniref:Helix-turn-helix domain-containing protein n=1 Tax=Hymenobacter elongatus TaxID=877208 RepID=A0A4Z0PLV6_9BACT|nr:helix-turn-helix transcriptional regulator [Hymenobacter elongatus]TGE16388.1 helix-turn-helix domain-containing protein [Hymenobacter elongatus]
MVERIRTLLQIWQLTPTQFADAIGVARPIVSHILSGRNKPSLEVVQKIIGAYPDLSLPWLLSGTSPMLAAAASDSTLRSMGTTVLPEDSRVAQAATKRAQVPADFAPERSRNEPQPTLSVEIAPSTEPAPLIEPSPPLVVPVAQPAPVVASDHTPKPVQSPPITTSSPIVSFAEPGKKIRRIVIFYQDGTFGDYQPE